MKKYRSIYLVVIIAVLFSGLWGAERVAPILFMVLLLLPVFTGAWFYLSLTDVSFSLTGERSLSCGQSMKLKLGIQYAFLRPAGNIKTEVTCENLVFGNLESAVYILKPYRQQQDYEIPMDTSVCGKRIVRIREIVCYDLLCLFCRRIPVEAEFICTVYPYETQMYISFQRHMEREQPGDIYDGRKSGTDVSEVFGLREYREGDPLQSIHWKLSGKMQQLIVREFGRPVNYHTLILLAPAFCYGDERVSEQIVNAVFDLGVSFCHALLNQNIAHFTGYFLGGEICCVPVDSLHSYEDMLLKLMNVPIQKNGNDTMVSFLDQQLYKQFTKVFYVTGAVNEAATQNLSVLSELTILQITDGALGYLAGSDGYEVIGVPIDKIRNSEHVIPL